MASICSRASERFIGGSFLADGAYFAPQRGESQERVLECGNGVSALRRASELLLEGVIPRAARPRKESSLRIAKAETPFPHSKTRPLPAPASICNHPAAPPAGSSAMLKFAPYVLKSLWRHR